MEYERSTAFGDSESRGERERMRERVRESKRERKGEREREGEADIRVQIYRSLSPRRGTLTVPVSRYIYMYVY